MFGRESRSALSVEMLIGSSARIHGDVEFEGGLHVDGRINGNVTAQGERPSTLSLGEQGVIEGNVEAGSAVLNGTVRGDIRVADKVVLGATARVSGTLYYCVIESAAGAQINGLLVQAGAVAAALEPEPLPPAAAAG